jgi:hypothetical protein
MKFTVFVDDNFHHSDESERYKKGDYPTAEAAVAACKQIVDDYLSAAYREGMPASELYRSYRTFGEDPFVVSESGRTRYSSSAYAMERCSELCAQS